MNQTMKTLTASINTLKASMDNAKVKGDAKWAEVLSQHLASLTSVRSGLELERYVRWNVTEVIR